MPKIDITKTELVWPGKYNDGGTRREVPRVNLPFQIIETIKERGRIGGRVLDLVETVPGVANRKGVASSPVRARNRGSS